MNDEIMKAIEQVALQASNDQERMEKEAYINAVSVRVRDDSRIALLSCTMQFPSSMQAWAETHRQWLSIQVGEVVRILLRKELLGE